MHLWIGALVNVLLLELHRRLICVMREKGVPRPSKFGSDLTKHVPADS